MNNSSGPGESFSTTWPDNRDNLPSYHIFLDFRLRESKQGVPQTERNLFVSRIVSAVRQARPDVHQNSATTIAVALEQKTFEKSKDKEEYRKIFHARLQQIQDSANQRRMARLRKGESVSNPSRLAEWKQEVTQTEREEFISQLTSEILLIQPNVDQGIAAATVVTSFERNALERSKDKEEYKQILQNRLQQIREVLRHREVAASQNRAREAHIERLSQQQQQQDQFAQQLPAPCNQQTPAQNRKQQLQYYIQQQQQMRLVAQQQRLDQEQKYHRGNQTRF